MFYHRHYREIFWISIFAFLFGDITLFILYHPKDSFSFVMVSFLFFCIIFVPLALYNSDGWRSEYRTCYERCGQCEHRKYCPHSNVNKIKI